MSGQQAYRFPFAAYPAVRLMICLITGIVLSHYLGTTLLIAFSVFVVICVIWLISEFWIRKKWIISGSRLAAISYTGILIAGMFTLHTVHQTHTQQLAGNAAPINVFEWEDVRITGTVRSTGLSSSGRPVYETEVLSTQPEDGITWYQRYRIRLYGNQGQLFDLQSGDQFTGSVRIYAFPERRNPHDFDYGNWLNKRGIGAHGELTDIHESRSSSRLSWGPLREAVLKNIDTVFSEQYSTIAKALLLGYKDELTPETRLEFSRAGLSHIMAVSGLHVGFLVAPFWLLIPFLWGSSAGRWLGLAMLITGLLIYAGVTGFSPSVSRASLMALLLTYGKLFHKLRTSVNLTAVAACIILLIQPGQLFDVGFQLSFSAVFIILLLMPEAQRLIPARYRYNKTGAFITIILVSVVVQAGLFPILVYYFGEFSITGPLANALVIPLLTFTVPAGILIAFFASTSPVLFQAGVVPVEYTLQWIGNVAYTLGSREFSYLTFSEVPVSLFLVWLFLIFLIASARIPALRWKILIAFLLSVNLFFVEMAVRTPSYKPMKVTFLDVGQGDAVHVKTPNGKHLLIDAGRWSPMSNSGDRVLLPYFEYLGVDRLDAVILSHPHADHIGGMPTLLNNLQIDAIYQSDYDYDSILYKTTINIAREKEVPVYLPTAGTTIDIDESLRLFVLGPQPNAPRDRNPNNHSVAIKLVYGQTSFLFSGDAETEQEARIAAMYGDFLESDLYKAGHHASNTSSTEVFMRYVQPDITVASLAFRNVFGHPGRDAVNRLHQYSGRQKYTSLSGAIRFESDGRNISRVEW